MVPLRQTLNGAYEERPLTHEQRGMWISEVAGHVKSESAAYTTPYIVVNDHKCAGGLKVYNWGRSTNLVRTLASHYQRPLTGISGKWALAQMSYKASQSIHEAARKKTSFQNGILHARGISRITKKNKKTKKRTR